MLLLKMNFKKLQTFDLSYFRGKSHFEDGAQNYLLFQPINRYFKSITGVGNGEYIYFGKSNLKVCLMKGLILLLDLITVLLLH